MGRLFHCGEHLRGSESGNLERFTVSLTSISLFLGVCFVFGVVVCLLFVGFWCRFVFLVLFPPTMLRSSSCPPELTTVRAVMVRLVDLLCIHGAKARNDRQLTDLVTMNTCCTLCVRQAGPQVWKIHQVLHGTFPGYSTICKKCFYIQ